MLSNKQKNYKCFVEFSLNSNLFEYHFGDDYSLTNNNLNDIDTSIFEEIIESTYSVLGDFYVPENASIFEIASYCVHKLSLKNIMVNINYDYYINNVVLGLSTYSFDLYTNKYSFNLKDVLSVKLKDRIIINHVIASLNSKRFLNFFDESIYYDQIIEHLEEEIKSNLKDYKSQTDLRFKRNIKIEILEQRNIIKYLLDISNYREELAFVKNITYQKIASLRKYKNKTINDLLDLYFLTQKYDINFCDFGPFYDLDYGDELDIELPLFNATLIYDNINIDLIFSLINNDQLNGIYTPFIIYENNQYNLKKTIKNSKLLSDFYDNRIK